MVNRTSRSIAARGPPRSVEVTALATESSLGDNQHTTVIQAFLATTYWVFSSSYGYAMFDLPQEFVFSPTLGRMNEVRDFESALLLGVPDSSRGVGTTEVGRGIGLGDRKKFPEVFQLPANHPYSTTLLTWIALFFPLLSLNIFHAPPNLEGWSPWHGLPSDPKPGKLQIHPNQTLNSGNAEMSVDRPGNVFNTRETTKVADFELVGHWDGNA